MAEGPWAQPGAAVGSQSVPKMSCEFLREFNSVCSQHPSAAPSHFPRGKLHTNSTLCLEMRPNRGNLGNGWGWDAAGALLSIRAAPDPFQIRVGALCEPPGKDTAQGASPSQEQLFFGVFVPPDHPEVSQAVWDSPNLLPPYSSCLQLQFLFSGHGTAPAAVRDRLLSPCSKGIGRGNTPSAAGTA